MPYHYSRIVELDFDAAQARLVEALKAEGFGVLTEIDVQATLKKKLDVDFRRYRILGACNPGFAWKALQAEDHLGLLLPCNLLVQERGEGKTEVSAVNPLETMKSVGNPALADVAGEVSARLRRVVDSV